MLDKIRSVLRDECLLDDCRVILAGVSGGPDSLCMLDILHRLNYPVVVAHLDHGLRPESGAEAERVRQAAASRGIEFILKRQDVQSFSQTRGLSIEEGARLARYRFLFEAAGESQAQAVSVGHSADDQVETVLMHLLRGAGMPGLSGMDFRSLPNAWSEEIPLVRPLLGVWREQIREYLDSRGLIPTLDESNLDTRFYRNRLRQELLPYLENFNPRIRTTILRTAEILRAEDKLLEEVVSRVWDITIQEYQAGYLGFGLKALREQPVAIQRRIIYRAVHHLHPEIRDLDFGTIQLAIEFVKACAPGDQADLKAGIRLAREGDKLWLADWGSDLPSGQWPQMDPSQEKALDTPGGVDLPEGWRLSAEIQEKSANTIQQIEENKNPFQCWMDREKLAARLVLRARRPGDRIQPLGMEGRSIKISDLMINSKLPARARVRWPLVISGEQVAWVPGVRAAHAFRVQAETRSLLYLRLEKS